MYLQDLEAMIPCHFSPLYMLCKGTCNPCRNFSLYLPYVDEVASRKGSCVHLATMQQDHSISEAVTYHMEVEHRESQSASLQSLQDSTKMASREHLHSVPNVSRVRVIIVPLVLHLFELPPNLQPDQTAKRQRHPIHERFGTRNMSSPTYCL